VGYWYGLGDSHWKQGVVETSLWGPISGHQRNIFVRRNVFLGQHEAGRQIRGEVNEDRVSRFFRCDGDTDGLRATSANVAQASANIDCARALTDNAGGDDYRRPDKKKSIMMWKSVRKTELPTSGYLCQLLYSSLGLIRWAMLTIISGNIHPGRGYDIPGNIS